MKPLRYFVGCTGAARGGWFVSAVIADEHGNEVAKKVSDCGTKREAKDLCARLNQELEENKRG